MEVIFQKNTKKFNLQKIYPQYAFFPHFVYIYESFKIKKNFKVLSRDVSNEGDFQNG
jgi:hypothetical protein